MQVTCIGVSSYPSQEHECDQTDTSIAQNIDHNHEYLEGKHIAFTNACSGPGAQMIIILN